MLPESDTPTVDASPVDTQGADPLRFLPLLGLVMVLLGGTILAFRLPPFQPADEYSHLCRAWQVAGGGILPQRGAVGDGGELLLGGMLPSGFVRAEAPMKPLMSHPDVRLHPTTEAQVRATPLAADEPQFVDFRNTAVYMPLNYLQFVPAMWHGRLLSLRPVTILLLARLSNVLVMALGVWAVLRLLPCYRIVCFLLLTLPTVLALAGAVTADTHALLLGALLTAWWLRCRETGETAWRRRDWVLLLVGAALLGWAKFVYLPLLWLWFLLPASTWPNRARARRLGLAACAVGLLATVLWLGVIMPMSLPSLPEVNPAEQIRRCLSEPLAFVSASWEALKQQHLSWHVVFVGSAGHADVFVGFEVVILFTVALLAASLVGRPPVTLRGYERGVIGATVVASTLAIFFVLYATWTVVGAPQVYGVQGRYFLPLAPAALLLISNHVYQDHAPRLTAWLALGVSLIGLTSMVMAVNLRYYG